MRRMFLPSASFVRSSLVRSRCFSTNVQQPCKAAAIIIGDEVLTGKVQDVNLKVLTTLCYKWGAEFIRAETITDGVDDIADTVQRLSKLVGKNGMVFTTGGIGPTHDDRTYEGVAKAFNTTLEEHEPTLALMRKFYAAKGDNQGINDARKRMATLPVGAEVVWTEGLWVPLAIVGGNVHIFPGIPRLFESMLTRNEKYFQQKIAAASPGIEKSKRIILSTFKMEGDIADVLREVAEQYEDSLSIGSYPRTTSEGEGVFNVKVTFDSRDEKILQAAVKKVEEGVKLIDSDHEFTRADTL